MKAEYVRIEPQANGVTVLRLDRPKMNALSSQLLLELLDAARRISDDPPGAVVVYGGERIFAAGAEIAEFKGATEALSLGGLFHEALDAIAAIPRVTIAAVSGFALGGGCELALACDFRMAAEGAKFGQPEILLGIIPGGGGTQRLPRLIGVSRAKDLILSGRQVGSEEAERIGLVDRVVPREILFEQALEWAGSFAQGALLAQGFAKRAIDVGLADSLHHGMGLERRLFAEVFTTEDAVTGVRSFFENGPGKAKFSGR